MHRPTSVPFPPLHPTDDDDSPSSSSHPTPRSSFLSLHDDSVDIRCRSRSLASVDSGYFSIMGKESFPVQKPFDRRPSRADLHHPRFPLNGASDTTQKSPKRDGAIRNFLRKKKKSLTFPLTSELCPLVVGRIPVDHPVPHVQSHSFPLSSPPSSPCDSYTEPFERQDRFIVRRGMKHHPYSREDAPYMLAYDRTLLDNDKFSEILLRRLNPNRSPSFHDFTHAVPKAILDLGCGPGGWAIEAAKFWPSSQVIGFDLLDPASLHGGAKTPLNVQWRQGNFVKYKLPFPKNMFDFVRMANLSLCIPHERWEHVLSEARRVLARGGHLELIDDYLYFPYAKHPPQPQTDFCDGDPLLLSSDFDEDCEAKEGTCAEQRSSDTDTDDSDNDDEDFVSTKSRFSTFLDEDDTVPELTYDPVSEWSRNVENSRDLETLFEDMLSRKFSVHPRPSKFVDKVIDKIFGRYNHCRLHEFNLYLAPPSAQDFDGLSVGSSEGQVNVGLRKAGKDFTKWVTSKEWDHLKEKEKKYHHKGDRSSGESLPNLSTIPDTVGAKAAGRLGIKSAPYLPRAHNVQSPGLILWPATFIPIPPFELEMHTCKHLHSLIGCKATLTEFVRDIAREKQLPFDEQIMDDFIWEYESFRRKRFNWPSECPDSHPYTFVPITTPRSNALRGSFERPHASSDNSGALSEPLFPPEQLDFVRSISVYSATKLDEEIHVS